MGHASEGSVEIAFPIDEMATKKKPRKITTEAWDRGRWLVMLMLMQSTSSWILGKYTALLEEHMLIISFLTMLVGAGGNAGAQAAVDSVRGIALGRPEYSSISRVLPDAAMLSVMLSAALGCIAWVRVRWVYGGDFYDACAISVSCMLIVVASVVLGATLPFLIRRLGFDPAHAGATIQVIMDISGVAITCLVCAAMLPKRAAEGLA
eukprot:TRINITY_DN14819_c0_g1_i1.p1 TRINITY_DN14819_c0_g1~~TRINITY_DN14819_c0_g1_i1.p1  ORF type:complete len:207 (+),score=32.06 TRINITY_DN14819_c0_g1_i1:278-898(+)